MNKEEITAKLQALLREPVQENAPMRDYTTWKIGGPADWLVMPSSEDELAAVLRLSHSADLPYLVIGNGSNLLVGDKGVRGIVIRMAEPFSGAVWEENRVAASAGMLLATLAIEAAERGLSGVEFARGIPGSVGGGVRMNAGAYGNTLGEFVTQIDAVSAKGEKIVLDRTQLTFAYRNSSLFDLDAVVTKVHFAFSVGDREEIMARMKDFQQRRSATQPLEYPSCGSVFRNPPDNHAGYLIECAGLRGTKCGGVEVSEKHGNFIVNRKGTGTAREARQLIELVQEKIFQQYNIKLMPEVRFIGEF